MNRIGARSFLRFLLVGGSATALHYFVMFALIHAASIGAGAASATGYTLSTFWNYWANARFTFGGADNHARRLPRFLLTALAGLGINQLLLLGLIRLAAPVAFAQLAATATVLLWNYFINATWAFAHRDPS